MDHNPNNGNARQRIFRSEEEINTLIEEYEKSGYSQREFCEVSDINESTFSHWLKRYRPKPEDEESTGFAKLSLMATCKLHDVHPYEWLKYVLTVMPTFRPAALKNCFCITGRQKSNNQ